MGRQKSFDERVVLERAMNLFWERGYATVGMAELLAGMRISRQSLYDTFGSKRRLFIRTIEHYRATQLAGALALLERDGSPVANVKDAVRFFEDLARDAGCRGCLVANALVEVGARDDEIAALLGDTLELLRAAIERSLRDAQRRGELAAERSPLALSRALTNAMVGLAVSGRLRLGDSALREISAGTLSLLD